MTTIPTATLQTGFTLIEAMIALLIFSVGLLGLAGMQMTGMQSNHSAILHTLAIQQSYDMAERIRANRTAVKGGEYNDMNSGNVACAADASSCSTQSTRDFALWSSITEDVLPSGEGIITSKAVDNNGDGTNDSRLYIITVNWVEPTGQNASISLEIQP